MPVSVEIRDGADRRGRTAPRLQTSAESPLVCRKNVPPVGAESDTSIVIAAVAVSPLPFVIVYVNRSCPERSDGWYVNEPSAASVRVRLADPMSSSVA